MVDLWQGELMLTHQSWAKLSGESWSKCVQCVAGQTTLVKSLVLYCPG